MSDEIKKRLLDNFGHVADKLGLRIDVSMSMESVCKAKREIDAHEVRVYDSNGAVIKCGNFDVVSHWFHGVEVGIKWGFNEGINYSSEVGSIPDSSVPLSELDEYFN
jgi:hypothetical protein